MTEPDAIVIAALITTIGGGVGTVLGHLLTTKHRVPVPDSLPSEPSSSSLPVGTARTARGISHWVEATFLGLMLGAAISWLGRSLFNADLGRATFLICAGFVAALPQWLVLRSAVRHANLWPVFSAFFVLAMQNLIYLVTPEVVYRFDIFACWLPWIAASLSLRLLAYNRGL
jgi:hypothetical protein